VANIYAQEAQRWRSSTRKRLAERALARSAAADPGDRLGQRRARTGPNLREDATRLATLADVGTGSPQIVQPANAPDSQTGNP